ncbi:MAG: type II toxin-antitoxin system VapC family toxin [Chloroflexi bacterium]|nr:type II toxin-antitoxin system VapC family toxin [Chloroflexota bacterium]
MATPRMVVVDASVWVARLIPQDVFHVAAREWMAARRSDKALLISPALLLPEIGGAISRRTGDRDTAAQVVSALERLPGLRLIEMERSLLASAAALAASLGLRGADAVYVAAAEYLRLPLCTLDDDQARRAAYLIEVMRIGE